MENLNSLCLTPEVQRDAQWEQQFLDAFVNSNVELQGDQAKQGPDGWPYMFVKTTDAGTEPVSTLLHWLSDKGIGLAVNPHKELPDYIFNYGMIWNYRERGLLLEPIEELPEASNMVEFKEGEKIFFGEPSQEFLPNYVREVLIDFFAQQQVDDPRVAIVGKTKDEFDLCFSLESLGNPPEKEHEGILEAIAWFLPNHYSLMLLSEDSVGDFFSLKSVLN